MRIFNPQLILIRKLRSDNEFDPGTLGCLVNPFYLIRRGLASAIRERAVAMKGKLLDFGCGARPYESIFEVEEYIGLDIEESGHPSKGKRADIYYDGKTIPLADASVDHVFAAEVFEHVFNPVELFREILRVLKPGGTFLMTCPFIWPLHEEPYDYARYTPYALEAMLSEAGFKSASTEKAGHPVEAMLQLGLMYCIAYTVPRIPILGGAMRAVYCGLFNGSARVLSKILPNDGKLYLSNIVVATKLKPE